jgi:ABC-type oligopeptide transport system ATPase subunit
MSDWIGVMYLGKLVEIGRAKTLCSQPRHRIFSIIRGMVRMYPRRHRG